MKRLLFIAAALAVASAAFAQLPAKYVTLPYRGGDLDSVVTQAQAPPAAPTTVPLWLGKAGPYYFVMVGQSPAVVLPNPSVTVPAPIIPVIFTFSGGQVFNPTVGDNTCLGGQTAIALTAQSPVFQNHNYVVGGTAVGNTQYVDFFQRANLWALTKPTGLNPNYHVLLNSPIHTPVNVTVPANKGSILTGLPCGSLGQIEINWFDAMVTQTIIPSLGGSGVDPTTFPIFIFYNVILYDTVPGNCCILGYHGSYANPAFSNHFQTYAIAEFDSTGGFGSSTKDVAALSHEVSEWMDDPSGTNPTPPWGNIGQVSGCQSNLEVGDPLSGTSIVVTGGPIPFQYHLQEEAFLSWFYHGSPSIGVNGWYSSNGTFTTFPPVCH